MELLHQAIKLVTLASLPPPPPWEAPDRAYHSKGEAWSKSVGCAGSAGDWRGLKDFSCGGVDSRGHPVCTGGLIGSQQE